MLFFLKVLFTTMPELSSLAQLPLIPCLRSQCLLLLAACRPGMQYQCLTVSLTTVTLSSGQTPADFLQIFSY